MTLFDPRRSRALPFTFLLLALALPSGAQTSEGGSAAVVAEEQPESATATVAPIASALAAAPEEVRTYNDHVVTLASPFMEGRVPGSRGMEIAKEYVEFYLREAGLEPPFEQTGSEAQDGQAGASYRQRFPLTGPLELISQSVAVVDGPSFASETDFMVMGYGKSGEFTGEVVFVGYSISRGTDGYETFKEDDDLSGKIALMLRFEPMDENGKSRWSERRWSGRAGFSTKLRAVKKHGPAAVIIVNPPGADDPRNSELMKLSGGRAALEVPVFHMTTEAGERLVEALDAGDRSLMDLRKMADEEGGMLPLGGQLHVQAEIERKPLMAENVAGLLPGRGDLAEEYVVIGAHLDHLGMGLFGSRSGSGELHPGADDNASGSAAILMLADKLAQSYAALPEDAPARSVLLMCFSAEESGLNGSRYYANNPIAPAEDHALMINFDMIGRIENKRLSVSGTQTAEGFKEWLQPFFESSPLEIVQPENMSGASDHTSFYQKEIPVLFGIIADFHGDYHTPRDKSSLINRVDAVHTINLFHEVAFAAATRPEPFEFKQAPRRERRARRPARPQAAAGEEGAAPAQAPARSSGIKVHFGVGPASYEESERGVLIASVTAGSSAEEAGVEDGDRLVKWNGEEIENVMSWMETLSEHEPDDKVEVTVERDGKEVVLSVTLKAPERDR